MKRMTQTIIGIAMLVGLGQNAVAKTDGILVVGTQAQVLQQFENTRLTPKFAEQNAQAMVAVRLVRGKMTVYEGEQARDLIDFIGEVIDTVVVVTLSLGSDLWEVLEDLVGQTVAAGTAALQVAVKILKNTSGVVIDGVTFVVMTAAEVFETVLDFLESLWPFNI